MAADPSDVLPSDQTPRLPAKAPSPSLASRVGAVAVRLVLDLVVLDAVVETWQAVSPLRTVVVAIAAVYFALSLYVIAKGGRIGGRGWLMDPVAPGVVFLGSLVACSWSRDGIAYGVVALRQPAAVVLSAALCAVMAVALVRMAGPGGARAWWLRLLVVAFAGYAVASMAQAAAARLPFLLLVNGHGFPSRAPWWLQGTWLGLFVLLPVAFLRELLASIARLAVFPYLRWMLVFGLAGWVAFNAASL